MGDILKEAIADAKAVRETALENAKMALEEAFTPQIKSMLSAKLKEEEDDTEDEGMHDEGEHEDDDDSEEGMHREGEREEQPGCVAIRIVPLGVQDQCGLIYGDNVIHQTGIVGSDERARARSISRKQCKGIFSRGASAGEELGGRRGAVVCNLRVVCKGIDNGSVVIGG